PYNPGFNISSVAATAQRLPSHSWEYGTASKALLELNSPLLSAFGPTPCPVSTLQPSTVPALSYAQTRNVIGIGNNGLAQASGAVSDPASLGVVALMLGKTNATFTGAAQRQLAHILTSAPRWSNGAISQRADVAELWSERADFIYMAPPFIAYYAADSNNASLLQTAYLQCGLYRQVLLFGSSSASFTSTKSATNGRWKHIVGPQSPDPGLWSTGNGWAAGGMGRMARVLATILKAPVAQTATWHATAVADLTAWIKEIVDGARASPTDGGLLRNYLNDKTTGNGFGEISGTSMIAAVAYRMVVLAPASFPASTYVPWANSVRATLSGKDSKGHPRITTADIATPAVNPLAWQDTAPWTSGSPEGNNFVVLLYAAWRDCVYAGLCTK
ncbi:hypothetical protein B0H11DRAFT_2401885, partial [Mycena galericulata]